jgi:thiol-disulfide isomerase/thioredoxin
MTFSLALRRLTLGGLLALLAATGVAAPLRQGDVAPPLLGQNRDGDPVRVSDFAGKVVVVTFWATWCPYCIKEMPILENVQNKVGKDRIAVIAVNTESRDVYVKAWRLLSPTMHLALLHDGGGEAQAAYGVSVLPHMLIIGRDGRIVNVYVGYSESELPAIVKDLNRAMAQPG